MARSPSQVRRRHSELHLESVARISSLPIVESGIHMAGHVYEKIKRANSLMSWSLDTAEQSLALASASAKPAIVVLNGPISTLDSLLCRGIDIVEQRVPAVHLPPHLIFYNTRDYIMNNKFVMPVLKRAGSVKEIGSQAANAAAERLDGALTAADKYVDRYLPPDSSDKGVEELEISTTATSKTAKTIEHGARLSRKLQKRLTRRTIAEARALKHQGTECIHVLFYVIELIVTDPKMAFKKSKELWASLSLPEPENQARPATLEHLLVLLTRESARRIVHLVNGTAALAVRAPRRIGLALNTISQQLLAIADATLKMAPLINKREASELHISALETAIQRLTISTSLFLERTAIFLAGRPKPKKGRSQSGEQNHNNHLTPAPNRSQNGID